VSDNNAWYLHGAQLLLEGGLLNRDFFDVNPPLILYLYMPVVWLHWLTGLTLHAAFNIYILLIAAGTFWLALRQLPATRLASAGDSVIAGFLLYVLAVFPGPDFGEREHLAALFILPYLLGLANRLESDTQPGQMRQAQNNGPLMALIDRRGQHIDTLNHPGLSQINIQSRRLRRPVIDDQNSSSGGSRVKLRRQKHRQFRDQMAQRHPIIIDRDKNGDVHRIALDYTSKMAAGACVGDARLHTSPENSDGAGPNDPQRSVKARWCCVTQSSSKQQKVTREGSSVT
jgi:hypothetical protein